MICLECGEEIPERSKFCLECGAIIQNPDAGPEKAQEVLVSKEEVTPVSPSKQVRPPSQEPAADRDWWWPEKRNEKIKWGLIYCGVFVVVVLAVVLPIALTGGSTPETRRVKETTPEETAIGKTFTNDNWSDACALPSEYEGSEVVLIGEVFTAPEKSEDMLVIQIFADPSQYSEHTILYHRGYGAPDVKLGDYVKVQGVVGKAFKGYNMRGAKITVPTITADTISKVEASELITGGLEVPVGQQRDQYGVIITIDRMVLQAGETNIFYRVRNNQPNTNATFYSFNTKLQVGTTQLNPDSYKSSQYGEVPSELLPGVEASGVLVFPSIGDPIPQTGSVVLHLEAGSEDYILDFNPYIFNISW